MRRWSHTGVADMRSILDEAAAGGAAVVFSSHQLDLVEEICRDVVVIAAGRTIAVFDDDSGAVSRRTVDLGLVGAEDRVVDALTAAGDAPGATIDHELRELDARAGAEAALEDGDVEAVLDDDELVWGDTVDPAVAAGVAAARQQAVAAAWAADNDVAPAALVELGRASALEDTFLDDGDGEAQGVRTGVAFLTALATFVIIVTYGPLVATSVVEEKSTRVVEVLLSRITAGQLLAGKVAGAGVAVVVQVLIVLGGLGAALAATDSLAVPGSVWGRSRSCSPSWCWASRSTPSSTPPPAPWSRARRTCSRPRCR